VPPRPVAEQVNVCPAVSFVTVTGPHPVVDVTGASGSDTVQVSVTLLVYQPFVPSTPEICGVIDGGVLSKLATIVSANAGTTTRCDIEPLSLQLANGVNPPPPGTS